MEQHAQSRDLQGVDRLGGLTALSTFAAASTARSARRTWASSTPRARSSSAAAARRATGAREPRRTPGRSARRRGCQPQGPRSAGSRKPRRDLPRADGPDRARRITTTPAASRSSPQSAASASRTDVRQPELARGTGRHVDDRRCHGHPRGLEAHGRLVPDRDREHDRDRRPTRIYQRCFDLAFNPTGDLERRDLRQHHSGIRTTAAAATVDRVVHERGARRLLGRRPGARTGRSS